MKVITNLENDKKNMPEQIKRHWKLKPERIDTTAKNDSLENLKKIPAIKTIRNIDNKQKHHFNSQSEDTILSTK